MIEPNMKGFKRRSMCLFNNKTLFGKYKQEL